MKNIMLPIAALFMLLQTGTTKAEVIGDINNDNKIDLAEAIYALQVTTGLTNQVTKKYFIKSCGGTNYEYLNSSNEIIDVNSNGEAIISFETNTYGSGGSDNMLVKLSSEGNVDWAKTFGTAANEYGTLVRYSLVGGYISVGYQSAQDKGVTIRRHDDEGVVSWTKSYNLGTYSRVMSFVELIDSSLILTGSIYNESNDINDDLYVLKVNPSGAIQWVKILSTAGYNRPSQIIKTIDSGFAIVGRTDAFMNSSNSDVWLIKLNYQGNIEWQKSYGTDGYEDYGSSIIQGKDGEFTVLGNTESFGLNHLSAWILQLDSLGNIEWQKSYSGTGYSKASSIIMGQSGGYVVSGAQEGYGWIFKTNEVGEVEWEKKYGDGGTTKLFAKTDPVDGYILAGDTTSYGAGLSDIWTLHINDQGVVDITCDLINDVSSTVQDTNATTRDHNSTVPTKQFSVYTQTEITTDVTDYLVSEEICY